MYQIKEEKQLILINKDDIENPFPKIINDLEAKDAIRLKQGTKKHMFIFNRFISDLNWDFSINNPSDNELYELNIKFSLYTGLMEDYSTLEFMKDWKSFTGYCLIKNGENTILFGLPEHYMSIKELQGSETSIKATLSNKQNIPPIFFKGELIF